MAKTENSKSSIVIQSAYEMQSNEHILCELCFNWFHAKPHCIGEKLFQDYIRNKRQTQKGLMPASFKQARANRVARDYQSDYHLEESSSPNLSDSRPPVQKKLLKSIRKPKKIRRSTVGDKSRSNLVFKKSKLAAKKLKMHSSLAEEKAQRASQLHSTPSVSSSSLIQKNLDSKLKANEMQKKLSQTILGNCGPENVSHQEKPFYCHNCAHLSGSLFESKIDKTRFQPNSYKDFLNAQFIDEVHSRLEAGSHARSQVDSEINLMFQNESPQKALEPISMEQFIHLVDEMVSKQAPISREDSEPGEAGQERSSGRLCSVFLSMNEFLKRLNQRILEHFLKCAITQTQIELALLILFVDFKSRYSSHNLVLTLHGMIRGVALLRLQTCGLLSKPEKKLVKNSILLCLGKYEDQLIERGCFWRIKNEFSEVSDGLTEETGGSHPPSDLVHELHHQLHPQQFLVPQKKSGQVQRIGGDPLSPAPQSLGSGSKCLFEAAAPYFDPRMGGQAAGVQHQHVPLE